MVHERDATTTPSRRRLLAALGAASTALAGCNDVLPEDASGGTTPTGSPTGGGTDAADADDASGPTHWPAIEAGESLSDFEDLDEWSAETGELSAAPDEARTGSQAAAVESDGERARIGLRFPDGIDMEGWAASLAVKPESADKIRVEFLAPSRGERLGSTRVVPDDFDGWFRMDCGYQQKPGRQPDLSNVTGIDVVVDGPDGGPSRLLVDDLRRTESAATGKVILAFYGGHQTHYDVAAELLAERDWPAAVPVAPDEIGGEGRMGRDELRELADRGWDVCSAPGLVSGLAGRSESEQRAALEESRDALADAGFEDGSRHVFFGDGMDPTTYDLVRDVHESAFLYNSGTVGVPPTEMHAIPFIWGPALHTGVRRHTNISDQYGLLTTVRVPPIVDEDDVASNRMSLDDFWLLLEHIEQRGLDVITPSDLVDGSWAGEEPADESPDRTRPSGVVLEAGQSHGFEGSGSGTSPSFGLEEGILVADVSHEGTGPITVDVTTGPEPAPDENLSAMSGGATGTSVMAVDGGTYRLEVDAEGAWSVDLSQPSVHADDLQDLPVEAEGTGSAYVGPLWTTGDVRVVATHDGDGPFVVDGYGADGSWEVLIHRTGEFDNSRSYRAGGPVWLNVEADGDWTLDVVDA